MLQRIYKQVFQRGILVAVITITVVGFFLWLVILYVFWQILHSASINVSYLTMAEALSTALAANAVFGAGYVAYRELSEISSSRHIGVADKLFNELNSPENVESRRWIFQNLTDDPEADLKNLTDEGQKHIKQVLNSLDRVAFLTQSGWIPDDIVMPWMHPMIYKAWQKLGPYVEYERKRRNEPYYYQYADELARRCQAWRASRKIDPKTTWLEKSL
jgi:heme/copper-type cytochrome/quinol oxidase subunit 2